MAEELDSMIRENAAGPESAGADGVQVKQHNLRDQIEVDKYLAGKDACPTASIRFRFVQGHNPMRYTVPGDTILTRVNPLAGFRQSHGAGTIASRPYGGLVTSSAILRNIKKLICSMYA
jgi:hypothetical protein